MSAATLAALADASRSIGYLDGVHRALLTNAGTWAIAKREAAASATLAFGSVNERRMREAFTRRDYALDMGDAATAAAGTLQAMLGLTVRHHGRWSDDNAVVVSSVLRGQDSGLRDAASLRASTVLTDDIAQCLDESRAPALVQAAIATMCVAAVVPSDPRTAIVARHIGLVVLARAGACFDLRFPPVSWALHSAPGAWETIETAVAGGGVPSEARVDEALAVYFRAVAHAAHAAGFFVESAAGEVARAGGSARTRSRELTCNQQCVLDIAIGLPSVSMVQLEALTGLTTRTLKRIVQVLEERGAVDVRGAASSDHMVVRARRAMALHLDAIRHYPGGVAHPWPDVRGDS
ncbi:hypothetical protein [Demequina sp.]|uniref:hypothetical protein n=1 Tax=Demequina sp. TaxID=2050685 RepID=UPI003A85370B